MKRRYFILSLLFFAYLNSFAQESKTSIKRLVRQIDKSTSGAKPEDSVLKSIQKGNDLVIGYLTYNRNSMSTPITYFLIAFKGNKVKAYKYLIKKVTLNNEKGYELKTFSIPKAISDSILNLLSAQKTWKLKCNEDSEEMQCSHLAKQPVCSMISDASSKGLIIMTKGTLHTSSFYAPEFFEYECCPGNEYRKRFLSTIAPIVRFFANN